jgi:hypothetical protein
MAIATYDPGKIVVSFAGRLITGFADGTFVNAERTEDAFALTIGARGEGARTRSRNQSGTVTLTLMQSSLSNDVLSAIASADALAGSGVGEMFIKDLNGTTLIAAGNAWIKKLPSVEMGKDLSNREWVFECEALAINVGGNA